MKTLHRLTTLLLTLVILFINVPTALAFPPLPSSFYGTVKINGANVPAGTQVSARINGVQYALSSYRLYNGNTVYSLDIPGDDSSTPGTIEGGVEGNTVVFFIGTNQATQTGTWHGGTNVRLDLSWCPGVCISRLYLPLVVR
jgi:hypothetical protein